MSLGDLRNVGRFTQDQNGYREELLQRLGDVDEVARAFAEEAEEGVAVTHHGVARRIEIEVDFPDGPAGEGGEDSEDQVQCHTGAVSDTGEDEAGRIKISICGIGRSVMALGMTYGAPDQPRMSVVMRKNIWPQLAVLMARAAPRHSASVALRGSLKPSSDSGE